DDADHPGVELLDTLARLDRGHDIRRYVAELLSQQAKQSAAEGFHLTSLLAFPPPFRPKDVGHRLAHSTDLLTKPVRIHRVLDLSLKATVLCRVALIVQPQVGPAAWHPRLRVGGAAPVPGRIIPGPPPTRRAGGAVSCRSCPSVPDPALSQEPPHEPPHLAEAHHPRRRH